MRKQTDLAAMKQLARVFLMMDPEPTSFSPVIIKHPFTDSGIVTVRSGNEYRAADITADEAVRSQWREQMASLIENAETPRHIYMMLTKSYRFAFLKYAMPYFSQKDFSEYLANAWVMCESPNNDPNFTQKQMLGLFKKADPQVLMDEDEYKQFQALEDTLVVYRGVTSYGLQDFSVAAYKAYRSAYRGEDSRREIFHAHLCGRELDGEGIGQDSGPMMGM